MLSRETARVTAAPLAESAQRATEDSNGPAPKWPVRPVGTVESIKG